MNNPYEGITSASQDIELTTEERRAIRQRVMAIVDQHPVTQLGRWRIQLRGSLRPVVQPLTSVPVFARVFMVLALLTATGASAAAERSVPGDLLYPVKIHLNENVRGALAFSQEAKAQWEATQAERRLEEAEQLASTHRLTPTVQTALEQSFQLHASTAQTDINAIATRDVPTAVSLGTDLEAALQAHAQILNVIATRTKNHPNSSDEATAMSSAVVTVGQNATKERHDDEEKLTNASANLKTSAAKRLVATEDGIANARRYLNKLEADGTVTTDAALRLSEADAKVIEGKSKLHAGADADAFALFGDADRLITQARHLSQVSQRLGIDVNQTLDATTVTPLDNSSSDPSPIHSDASPTPVNTAAPAPIPDATPPTQRDPSEQKKPSTLNTPLPLNTPAPSSSGANFPL